MSKFRIDRDLTSMHRTARSQFVSAQSELSSWAKIRVFKFDQGDILSLSELNTMLCAIPYASERGTIEV